MDFFISYIVCVTDSKIKKEGAVNFLRYMADSMEQAKVGDWVKNRNSLPDLRNSRAALKQIIHIYISGRGYKPVV